MHFWIDKRSQAFGRPRVSASLSNGGGFGFNGSGLGFNPNNRRLRGKSMVTPIHRFPMTRQQPPVLQPQPIIANHTTHQQVHNLPSNLQQQQINNQHNLQQHQQQQHLQPGQIHQHNNYHVPVSVHNIYESSPNSLEIDHGSIDINTIPRQHLTSVDGMGGPEAQLLPAHLKCGMWASLALATVFVAGAKFYFDHQGTGLEVLIFCAFSATFFLAACTVSLYRRPRDLSLSPHMGIDQLSNSDQISLQHNNDIITSTTVNIHPPQGNVIVAPPPPYHIAILLPENIKELEEAPPPSYDKIVI